MATKNKGLFSAHGRYITFLDSDDEYKPDHLARRKRILERHPDVRFLYGGVQILGNQYVPDRFDHSKSIHLKDCVIGGTFFVERKFLLALNGFRPIAIGTDADLFDRIKETGLPMMETLEPTYIYHHDTEDSITNRAHNNEKTIK